MTRSVAIRLERPEDRDRSLEVERLAFGSASEAEIVVAVRDLPGSFALVAEATSGEVVGHVQLSPATIGNDAVLALGPIGLVTERQGEGAGSALIRGALDEARARGWSAVVLVGSTAFYPRFGFEPAAGLGLRNPFTGVTSDGIEIHEEDFQVAVLDERARSLAGTVRWHPSFGGAG